MSKKPDINIAVRASLAIADYARKNNISPGDACVRMGLCRKSYLSWRYPELHVPDARTLQAFASIGLDVVWILTGKKG